MTELVNTFRYLPWWFWLSVFMIGVAGGYYGPVLVR